MHLIVGLGNPGASYARHRHNIGFMVIDALAGDAKFSKKFSGEVATITRGGEKIILLKPQTFMNNSGQSVQAAKAFHKLKPEQIIVIHDELDLPLGDVKLKKSGGNAGHNGLKSIDQAIGNHYPRIRIGVGPVPKFKDPADFVLENFQTREQPIVALIIKDIVENIEKRINEFKEENFTNKKYIFSSPIPSIVVSAKESK